MQIYFISFRFLLLAHKTTPFFHCFYLNILSFYVWPGRFHFLFRLNMFFLFSLAWTFCLIILFGLDIFFHILFIGLTFSFLFFFGLNIFFHYFILGEGGGVNILVPFYSAIPLYFSFPYKITPTAMRNVC